MTDTTQKAQGSGAGETRPYPKLLTSDEAKALLSRAETLWSRLEENDIGGFSGINRPFYILHEFKSVIEEFGGRDVGLHWSKDQLDAAALSQPPEASEVEAVLSCDVMLPPATTVRAGCSFETLRLAMSLPDRPKHFVHPPKASPMQELQKLGQEFDANVEASALRVTGEMLKAALLEEGGDAYMRNEGTPSHFLIDGIVDLDAVARSLAQPAPEQGEG